MPLTALLKPRQLFKPGSLRRSPADSAFPDLRGKADVITGALIADGKQAVHAIIYDMRAVSVMDAQADCNQRGGVVFDLPEKSRFSQMERRACDYPLEVRADGNGADKTFTFSGYAVKYNVLSEPVAGLFCERIAPGAFDESLKIADVRALFNHNPDHVLGRVRANTLQLNNDSVGLRYNVTSPAVGWINNLAASVQRGDITGSSFAFFTVRDMWDEQEIDGERWQVRTVLQADIRDISVVTFPQYSQSNDVSVRAAFQDDILFESGLNLDVKTFEERRGKPMTISGESAVLQLARIKQDHAERF